MMAPSRHRWLVVMVAVALLGAAPDLAAQSTADSAELARLRTRLATLDRTRIRTQSWRIEVEEPRLTVAGVTWSAMRPLGEGGDTAGIAAPVPLDAIERIEARRPPLIPFIVLGGIAGGMIGREILDPRLRCVTRTRGPECEHNIRSLLGYVALGAGAGVLVSWRLRRWQTIWSP